MNNFNQAYRRVASERIGACFTLNIFLSLLFLGSIGHRSVVMAQSLDAFTATGDMIYARKFHTATLLPNGKVLIVDGSPELYDPDAGTFTLAGNMTRPLSSPSATLLGDGRVLIVGRDSVTGKNSTELYDPANQTFTSTGSTVTGQIGGWATLLHNGKVLIAGGFTTLNGPYTVANPELYDPSTGTFTATGAFATTGGPVVAGGPFVSAVSLLSDGRVLFAGKPNSELYDPAGGKFSVTGSMTTPCSYIAGRTATLLQNGKVLLAGGEHEDCGRFANAELYDPATETFSPTGDMTRVRTNHTATLLSDGTVLIAGGESVPGTTTSAESYDPSTGTFASVGDMTASRGGQTATLLKNHRVLIAGGYAWAGIGASFVTLNSAELYTPPVVPPPILFGVFPDLTAPGATIDVTLNGANFINPLTIDAGGDIAVDNIRVRDGTTATATFTVASSAALGARSVTVTTTIATSNPVTISIVPPFPDLSVTSSHVGNLALGFDGIYTVDIHNLGTLAAPGPMTLTDTLPAGLTYVSGTGSGWSCSAADQTVTCGTSESLAAGASTSLTLTVAVGAAAASGLIHKVAVDVAGDPIPSNNSASDPTVVAAPSPSIELTPSSPQAGRQATVGVTLPAPFPYDVTGMLTLAFSPNAAIPADDPAIQFASGGRSVSFTIPANTRSARFPGNSETGPIGFQVGTVAGTLSFNGTLQIGAVETAFSATRIIPPQPPEIHSVEQEFSNGTGIVMAINLSSTFREVTFLELTFITTPPVRLSCGAAAGCVALGNRLTLNVISLFRGWFLGDSVYGSVSTLRVPLSIQGKARGIVRVSLRNSLGASNDVSFTLP